MLRTKTRLSENSSFQVCLLRTASAQKWAIPENIQPPPPPPPWTTLNWVPKNFRISKKDNCSFCKIPEPADSKSCGIPEFRKKLNGFPGIPVKIYKILGKFVDFRSYSLSISYRISIVVHGWYVHIFWNSPISYFGPRTHINKQLKP